MSSRVTLSAPPTEARAVSGGSQAALDQCIARVREQGFAAGVAAGVAQAREGAAQALDQAVQGLEEARQELLPSVTEDVAWLATEIARHLLRVEIEEGRYDLQAIVRDTLEASGAGRCNCTVHLHPDDAAALEGVAFRAGTTIEPDVEVQRGDVHVTTPRGLMVRDLDSAIDGIREALQQRSP